MIVAVWFGGSPQFTAIGQAELAGRTVRQITLSAAQRQSGPSGVAASNAPMRTRNRVGATALPFRSSTRPVLVTSRRPPMSLARSVPVLSRWRTNLATAAASVELRAFSIIPRQPGTTGRDRLRRDVSTPHRTLSASSVGDWPRSIPHRPIGWSHGDRRGRQRAGNSPGPVSKWCTTFMRSFDVAYTSERCARDPTPRSMSSGLRGGLRSSLTTWV